MDLWLTREAIGGIAIAGGLLATVGAFVLARKPPSRRLNVARWLLYSGYGLCGISMALFIVAGFRQAYL
ncbi:MAG: hypothetical protein ACR2RL_17655 [Gammaproteobacteria bacterium]